MMGFREAVNEPLIDDQLIGHETDLFISLLNHTPGFLPMCGSLPMLRHEMGKYILEWHFMSGPIVREEFTDVFVEHLRHIKDGHS